MTKFDSQYIRKDFHFGRDAAKFDEEQIEKIENGAQVDALTATLLSSPVTMNMISNGQSAKTSCDSYDINKELFAHTDETHVDLSSDCFGGTVVTIFFNEPHFLCVCVCGNIQAVHRQER